MLEVLHQFKRRRGSSRSSAEPEDHLCSACQGLELKSLLKYGTEVRGKSISSSLAFSDVKSQKKSCHLCSLTLEGALAVLESKQEHYVDKKILSIRTSPHARHQLKISVSGTYRLPLDLRGRVGEAYSQKNFVEHFYLQELPPSLVKDDRDVLVDERPIDFEEVKRWLNTCHHDHGVECDAASTYSFVSRPKRLTVIDVEEKCLVELPKATPYAALSYVWGGVQLLHLNSGNRHLLTRPQGLLSPELLDLVPATIWDAIKVTKEIGLQYLWIDSLCIQQDDSDQTNHMISQMNDIFGSAYVTLIAADGTSASSGLLGTAFSPRRIQYGLKVVKDDDRKPMLRFIMPGMFLGVVALDHKGVIPSERWNIDEKTIALPQATNIADSLWNSRAWTYQEAQLSSRTLVFLDGQVFWHCNLAVWSEHLLGRRTNKRGHAIDKRYSRLGNLTSNPHFRNTWGQHDSSIEVRRDGRALVVSSEAFLLYKDLVAAYTPRDMSNINDKLSAFDGIGKVLERCLDSEFLFGLPESLLDLALLWHANWTLGPVKGPGFPSWSWAGWKGAVEYPEQYGVSKGGRRDLHDDESRPERVRPLNRWYKPTRDGLFEPINEYGCGIREAIQNDGNLPVGWKGFLAENSERNIDIDDQAYSLGHLRCYTMKANLQVKLGEIYDSDDKVIGEFSLDEGRSSDLIHTTLNRTQEKRKVSFITLSEAQFFRSQNLTTSGPGGDLYDRPHDYTLYNIMAVEWSKDGQTAYRRGLGRVFQRDWESSQPEYQWINLG